MVDTGILGKYFEANRTSTRFVDLDNEGDKFVSTILSWEETTQYYKGQPQYWPAKPGKEPEEKKQLTMWLEIDGVKHRMDVPKSKQEGSKMSAINAALAEAQAPLQVGGSLAMKVTSKTPFGEGFSRKYASRYQPPVLKEL